MATLSCFYFLCLIVNSLLFLLAQNVLYNLRSFVESNNLNSIKNSSNKSDNAGYDSSSSKLQRWWKI